MEIDLAVQVIAVLVALWGVYVTRAPFKKNEHFAMAKLFKKAAELSMLNLCAPKKSTIDTTCIISKKIQFVNAMFTIGFQKKCAVISCANKKAVA